MSCDGGAYVYDTYNKSLPYRIFSMIPRFTLDNENATDPQYAYFLAEIARLLTYGTTCARASLL